MSEHTGQQARYDIERLSSLAVQLGYARSPNGATQVRPAPHTTAANVDRYVKLAGEMGLTGPRCSVANALPSLGR